MSSFWELSLLDDPRALKLVNGVHFRAYHRRVNAARTIPFQETIHAFLAQLPVLTINVYIFHLFANSSIHKTFLADLP